MRIVRSGDFLTIIVEAFLVPLDTPIPRDKP